jgi:molecular chaperone DnaK (HSP70)
MSADAPYFGIDFGTTNSSMAWYNPKTGQAETLLNDYDEAKTPSLVYFDEDEILVGKDAEEKIKEFEDSPDPVERDNANQRVVRSIKRNLIDPPVIPIPGREPVRPVEVVAHILGKLKRDAQKQHFREEIERAVITCPAVFGMQEQEVLLEAAAMVGFRRVELLEEPTAAALAFTRLGRKVGKGVLVYDLGAGTFDLSVVAREEEDSFYLPMEPEGDAHCGGDDLDLALYRYCDGIARRDLERPISLTEDIDLVFLRQCRERKEMLSSAKKSRFSSLLSSNNGLARFRYEIDRETFEGLIRDRIESTVHKTTKLWERVKDEVDTVILIGGSSRVPLVERLLAERLTAIELRSFAGRDYAVALGAAYHAYDAWGRDSVDHESQEIKEYHKALKSCWNNRWLTRTEVEWLANLVKQELKLDSNTTERVERRVLGDTIENVLKLQEPVARDRYRMVLKLGWKDKKLDALRRIPPARLNMLLDDQDRFCDFDFADSPVKAAERKEMLGELPWPVFVLAARVAADSNLSATAVADRLDTVSDELGLSRKHAATIEREVLGSTLKEFFKRQEQAPREYRKAVERTCVDGKLVKAKVDRLGALRDQLGLNSREVADIERNALGDTVAAVLVEQEEVGRLARRHKTAVSKIKGTGKLGRVTRRDMEAYIEEQNRKERKEQERKEQERKERERRQLLILLRSRLDQHGEKFVAECEKGARKIMDSDADWQNNLGKCLNPALKAYAKGVQKEAQAEVAKLRLGLTVPTFPTPKLSAEIQAAKTSTSENSGAGAVAGGVTGAAIGTAVVPVVGTIIGGLIGAALGSGAEEGIRGTTVSLDTDGSLANVREAAHGLRPALKEEAKTYLNRVENAVAAKQKSVRG